MLAVVQRVSRAWVGIDGRSVGEIGRGLVAFVAVEREDTGADSAYLASKLCELRILPDEEDKMNLSLKDVQGQLLLVPNFTVAGDCRKGRRPSFDAAAPPEKALSLFRSLVEKIRAEEVEVQCGVFGETMEVHVENYGPVTLLLDSRRRF